MKIKYPVLRYNLQRVLLNLGDIDYQREVWLASDRPVVPTEYVGFHIEVEVLLDDFVWEERERLIGVIFRNATELQACLDLVDQVMALLDEVGKGRKDVAYMHSRRWSEIVSLARAALRTMLA